MDHRAALTCVLLGMGFAFAQATPAQLPTLLPHQTLEPPVPTTGFWAWTVAIDRRTAFIGAPFQFPLIGSVDIFLKDRSGLWVFQSTLRPPISTDPIGSYAEQVEVDGDSALVSGTVSIDPARIFSRGVVHVYRRVKGTWRYVQTVSAPEPVPFDAFGRALAIDGRTAVIGAFNTDTSYVYKIRSNGTLELQATLRPSDAPTGGRLFGRDVAVDDGTIVIGADQDADARGAAYVFRRSGGTWQETQKLTASDPAPGEFFGFSVAVSGRTVVIAAPSDNPIVSGDTFITAGAAYVFVRRGNLWSEQQKLVIPDDENGAFAISIAIDDDRIMAAAADRPMTGPLPERVYEFSRRHGRWTAVRKLLGGPGGTAFGQSMDLSDSTLLVGASSAPPAGQAFIYELPREKHEEETEL